MGRPNWHYDNPPACTCADCARERLRKPRSLVGIMKEIIFRVFNVKIGDVAFSIGVTNDFYT